MSEKVEDSVKGRVVSQMQSDLAPNQDAFHWRKIKLIVDHTEGRQALTSFYGVDIWPETGESSAHWSKKEKNPHRSRPRHQVPRWLRLENLRHCFHQNHQTKNPKLTTPKAPNKRPSEERLTKSLPRRSLSQTPLTSLSFSLQKSLRRRSLRKSPIFTQSRTLRSERSKSSKDKNRCL